MLLTLFITTITLMFFNSTLNPILYCWRIKEVRRACEGPFTLFARVKYSFFAIWIALGSIFKSGVFVDIEDCKLSLQSGVRVTVMYKCYQENWCVQMFFFVMFNEKLDSTFKFISPLYNPNNFLTIEHKTFQLSFPLCEKYPLSKRSFL